MLWLVATLRKTKLEVPMPATDVVRARIAPKLKRQAMAAAEAAGMTISIAIVLLMHRLVADPDFAETLKVPNAETIAAIEDDEGEICTLEEYLKWSQELNEAY